MDSLSNPVSFSLQILDKYEFGDLDVVERFYPILFDPDSGDLSKKGLVLLKFLFAEPK